MFFGSWATGTGTLPGTRVLSKLLALLKQQGKTREARELQAKFGGSASRK